MIFSPEAEALFPCAGEHPREVAFLGATLQYLSVDAQSENTEGVFRDGPKHQTLDVQLQIGESSDSRLARRLSGARWRHPLACRNG
jgi:hypothetical protein